MVGRWELRSPLETTSATALGEPGDGYEGSAPWPALCLRSGRRTVVGDNLLCDTQGLQRPQLAPGGTKSAPARARVWPSACASRGRRLLVSDGGSVGDGGQLWQAGAALNLVEKI